MPNSSKAACQPRRRNRHGQRFLVIVAFCGKQVGNDYFNLGTDQISDARIKMVREPNSWGLDLYVHLDNYDTMNSEYGDMLPPL